MQGGHMQGGHMQGGHMQGGHMQGGHMKAPKIAGTHGAHAVPAGYMGYSGGQGKVNKKGKMSKCTSPRGLHETFIARPRLIVLPFDCISTGSAYNSIFVISDKPMRKFYI